MKKIFAVSLIAMTAVSAANAQIASKAYVDVSSNGNIVLTTNTAGQNIRALDQAIGQLPAGKTAAEAIADAVSGASSAYQPKSSGASIGGEGGTWTALTADQLAAMNSGIDATKRAGYDTLVTNAANYGDIVTHNVSEFATSTQGGKADTAVQSVVEGTTNGTVAVDGTDVAVHGLGSAAYTPASDYATAAQGAKADTALQQSNVAQTYDATGTAPVSGAAVASAISTAGGNYATAAQGALADSAVQSVAEGSTNGTVAVDGTDVAVHGLGSAAYTPASDYATAAQGAKADTAVQPGDLGTMANETASNYTKTADMDSSTNATAGQVVTAISMADGQLSQTTADPLSVTSYAVGADGKYALTAVVSGGSITGYKWELISRDGTETAGTAPSNY